MFSGKSENINTNMKLQCDLDYDVIVLAPGVKFQCDLVTYEVNASGEVVQIA